MAFLTLAVPAASYPITHDDAKAHLRVRGSREDAYIDGLIGAAITMIERDTGRALAAQTWDYKISRPSDQVKLPIVPVASITSMTYFDTDDVSQSLTVADYYLFSDDNSAVIAPKNTTDWPNMKDRPDALTVRYVAGYGASVPEPLKHAAKLLLAHWFENREILSDGKGAEVPRSYWSIISSYRLGWFA